MKNWNPYYKAYAKAHDMSPEDMLAYDKGQRPGGCMCEYMIWINTRWSEWHEAQGLVRGKDPIYEERRKAFEAWLLTEPQKQVEGWEERVV